MPPQVRTVQYDRFDGAVREPMPKGDYLSVRTLDSQETSNESLWQLWDRFNREAQHISTIAAALQPVITQDQMAHTIDAINRCFADVSSRVVTRASRIFADTFGGPHAFQYQPYPIRWGAESRYTLSLIMPFVSAIFQIPQVRSNRLDNGVLESHATIILRPLFMLKASIMKTYFGAEIKGEISPSELDALFRSGNLKPPLGSSFDDLDDNPSDKIKEDAQARTDESAKVPTQEALDEVSTGQEVWQWVPDKASWATFAEIQRRLEADGPSQVPGEPFPFPTGNVVGGGSNPQTSAAGANGLVTPSTR